MNAWNSGASYSYVNYIITANICIQASHCVVTLHKYLNSYIEVDKYCGPTFHDSTVTLICAALMPIATTWAVTIHKS